MDLWSHTAESRIGAAPISAYQLAGIVDDIYLRNVTSSWVRESCMRWVLIVLAVAGIAASSLALREHYRTDPSPCSINEKWDCGIVNHSPYALFHGIPVAVIGIAGYLLLGALAAGKSYPWMLPFVTVALIFAIHLERKSVV